MKSKFIFIVIIVSLFQMRVSGSDVFKIGQFYYQIISDGEVELVKNPSLGPAIDKRQYFDVPVIIPNEIIYKGNVYKVVSIGKNAFEFTQNIDTCFLGNNIKKIKDYAFSQAKFNEIVMNEGLDSIMDYAFLYAEIHSVKFPSTVTYIGDFAFIQNSVNPYLKKVSMGDIKAKLGRYCFGDCAIDSIVFSDNIEVIPYCCLNGSSNLKYVELGENTKEISNTAFSLLPQLETVHFKKGLKKINNDSGDFFSYCDKLKTIIIDSELPPVYDGKINTDVYKNASLYVPVGSRNWYYITSPWNKFENIIENVHVSDITITNIPSYIFVGDKLKLDVSVLPDNAINKRYKLFSSNDNIATINNEGDLVAKAYGTIIITAKSDDGDKIFEHEVNIFEHVEKLLLNQVSLTLKEGETFTLVATPLPYGKTLKNITYRSDNEAIATVDHDGIVKAIKNGATNITAKSLDGGFEAICNVTVNSAEKLPTSVSLDNEEATIKVGEATTLKANVLPVDADDKTIVWSSENSDIASVTNDGVVTGHKAGTTKIIVTTNANGLKDECILTVHQPVTGITLDRQNISFANIGETVQLTANVLPEDASNKNVSWASSDTKVAIVSNGNVVCTGYGTAVISAITEDGGYMATCVINATSGINGINEDKGYQDAKRYDATGREINNPINGLNIIKTQDGRVIKTNKQ